MTVTALPATTVLWVAAGGAIGAALRFLLGEWARQHSALGGFPWATLGINVTGSLMLGLLAGGALLGDSASPQLRAMLMIGVLGGFTTFSSFSLETLTMLQAGAMSRAALYTLSSVALSVGAAALGMVLARGARA
jgi:CrcB protein